MKIENEFYQQLRDEQLVVKVFIASGCRLTGTVIDNDQNAILFRTSDGVDQLIYKRYIESIRM